MLFGRLEGCQMAQSPCEVCGVIPKGSLRKTYLSYYADEELVRWRLSTCGPCAEETRNPWLKTGEFQNENSQWQRTPAMTFEQAQSPSLIPEPPAKPRRNDA